MFSIIKRLREKNKSDSFVKFNKHAAALAVCVSSCNLYLYKG